jgi:hypothetical protein
MSSLKTALLVVALLVGMAVPAAAAEPAPAPAWALESLATPTNFSVADNAECLTKLGSENAPCDGFTIFATDVGSRPTDGSPITIADTLPPGVTVQHVSFFVPQLEGDVGEFLCTTTPLQCRLPTEEFGLAPLAPGDTLRMTVYVTVDEPAAEGPLTNSATISGGGVPPAGVTGSGEISDATPPFGLGSFGALAAGLDGAPDPAAGGHPNVFTTTINPNTVFSNELLEGQTLTTSVEDFRDVAVDLPLGFFGSALAAPECSSIALDANLCPPASVVGRVRTEPQGGVSVNSPIWNLVPERGSPAQFGYRDIDKNVHALYPSVVPTPAGYVLRVTSPELPQVDLDHIFVTFYGDPAAHDAGREPEPGDVPFFTNPSSCDGQALTTSVHVDSWQQPATAPNPDGSPDFADPAWISGSSQAPPVSGCEALRFEPSLKVSATTSHADSPSGIEVDLTVPQIEEPQTPATPPLKEAVIALPSGLTVNPSSANGLAACSLAQIGMSASGLPDGADPTCPDASKLGTVELETPAIAGILRGEVYLARQDENPFGSLLALYIVVDDPTTGVLVKIPAEVKADPQTGRLTTVVSGSPQFPFSELRTHFFAGDLGALRTPATCGSFQATSRLTPWSAPQSGPPATPGASFAVTAPAAGSSCPQTAAQEPNAPSFEAGTENPTAGAYSPFVLKLSRADGSQELSGIDTTLPKGLLGRLAGIPYCSDGALAAAAARSGAAEQASPSCPAASQVGVVTVGAGAGPKPYYAQGKAYLAGPYKGAPLSLAIVTPAVAGPFDLGTVVVRTALDVDPLTAQIHAVSDPFPRILQGIPLDLRSIVLRLDRPSFTLNPTSCDAKSILGAATSVLGQSAPLAQRFQVGGCERLGFKPTLKLSLKGSTKRSGVPALKAVLTYPKGSYANVKSVSTVLPKSEFIDNAHIGNTCTRVQFNAGAGHGAECPKRSILGHALAYSPLLEAPLEGTVYFRSNGGERELPDLVVALKGQIDVTLVGFIDSVRKSKRSEVSRLRTRFMNVPDAPVSRFVLQLAGAKRGLLQNSANLCKVKNIAQVKATGQNGKTYDTEPAVANDCGKKHGTHGKSKGKRKSGG